MIFGWLQPEGRLHPSSTTRHVLPLQTSNLYKFTFPIPSRMSSVVKEWARSSQITRWPLVLSLAVVVYFLSIRPDATSAFINGISRAFFTTVCILISLQRPTDAFNKPSQYATETLLQLLLAGGVSKVLIARVPAQAPSFVSHIHRILCTVAFSMAGTPFASVPLPQTGAGATWLLTMFSSTLLGVVLPMMRWYVSNYTPNSFHSRRRYISPWNTAQIVSVGLYTISGIWLALAQIAAAIE